MSKSKFSRRSMLKSSVMAAGAAALASSGLLSVNQVSAQAGPSNVRGVLLAEDMPNPQMQAVLDEYAKLGALPPETLSAENARQLPGLTNAVVAVIAKRIKAGEDIPVPEPVGKVSHKTIPGPAGDILVRVYTPTGAGPFPVTVYMHGGGWVIANLDSYDSSCRALTNAAGTIVISVAYRQAPEHKFPAAPDDSFAVYQWVLKNAASIDGDPNRVAIAGESAGGNLAAVVSLMARDKGVTMPVHQLLVYPITNYAFDTESYNKYAAAKPLGKALMMWFWQQYLSSAADADNPYASPLRAKDLKGLPPTTILTAEIDPLASEGQAYAARLKDAGIPVHTAHYMGVTHEFFSMSGVIDDAKKAVQEGAGQLKAAFASKS